MAHVVGTLSQHDQFKIRYASKIAKYLSSTSILQEKIPFREKERTGESYVMPILLKRGHSASYAASGAGQVNFRDLKTSQIKKATLKGSQIFMGDGADWEAMFSSDAPGAAFSDEADVVIYGLMDSHRFRIEMDTLWGQAAKGSLGQVSGAPSGNVVTLLAAETSPGILFQLEDADIEVFTSALTTKRTGPNSDGSYTVTAVDPEAGKITVNNAQNIADTDVIFFAEQRTASAWKAAAGLHVWAVNAGSLAGIDAATNILWKSNSISANSGPLSFDLLLDFSTRVINRGHVGKLCAIMTPKAWANAMADMSATVRRTPQERKYVLGAEAISFFTGSGEIECIAHPYEKNGYCHIFPQLTSNADGEYSEDQVERAPLRRIGAVDLTFVGPDGKANGKKSAYFEKLQRTNLFYTESYSHQALFVSCPSRIGVITDIVNS